jgi:hypothetical protein
LCRGLGNALVPILPREIVIPSEEKKDDAMDEGSKEPAPKDLSSLSVRELKAIATQVVNPSLVNLLAALFPF